MIQSKAQALLRNCLHDGARTRDRAAGRARRGCTTSLVLFFLCLPLSLVRAELPAEKLGRVETLPVPYPAHWFFAHDAAFHHMLDGKMILLDADAETQGAQIKGMFNGSFVPHFTQSRTRPELYVSETYYSRGNRGERTDVVTVYDMATLSPQAEIILPGAKRAGLLPGRYNLHLTNDESLLLSFNFGPATSVAVIDVKARRVLKEIPLPSCALMYPTGTRGFSSLCGNASLISFQLDASGEVASRRVVEPFFDIDEDALFEKPAIIDGTGYFPTFLGNVQEINFRGDHAVPGKRWSLVSEAERAQSWRPGGLQLTAADAAGRMYVLMHPEGREGSHKDGGPEVWVYDAQQRARVQRVVLKNRGITVEVTQDRDPLLLVVNTEMNVDVYRAADGGYLRTLSDFGQETPLVLHAIRRGPKE
ncbi:MAG: amine dehydrogenase [Gammaproteobacteria bacterium]|nr:amine dehydrogenase [Gammaproteobacteria bacterium]